jgi:GNAT superfamily N-acetyltransferase
MGVEIVPATEATLAEIELWLKAEQAAHDAAAAILAERWDSDVEIPERGFLCNWSLVRRAFERDPANVHVLLADGGAVGFVDKMDILEVRPDQRGNGFGRRLAEFMVGRAFDQGYSVAEIEIAPESALPFWRAMGFTADLTRQGAGGGIYAFRRFYRPQVLGNGPRVTYRVAFHPSERDWDKATAPFQVFEGQGEVQTGGRVRLPDRAYCFDEAKTTSIDCVVSLDLAGERLFEDKVKRPEAGAFGVKRDAGGVYFLDFISAAP